MGGGRSEAEVVDGDGLEPFPSKIDTNIALILNDRCQNQRDYYSGIQIDNETGTDNELCFQTTEILKYHTLYGRMEK